jgi:glycosyltransferase involved in cell wall biosynthesis
MNSTYARMSDRPPRKICHVAATTEGATWMVEQLRELRNEKGWDVSAVISEGNGGLVDKLREENIPFYTLNFQFPGSLSQMRTLLKSIFELAALYRRERFDIVQTHLFQSMMLGRFAAWLADVPVRLAMIAGPYHLEAYTPRWIDRSTCWMETGLIASCEYTRTLYRDMGVKESKLSLVYYGPDERNFDSENTEAAPLHQEFNWSSDTPIIGMIAYFYQLLPENRWTPSFLHNQANKRHEDLIKAAPIVLREFPEAKFLLVGSGWSGAGRSQFETMQELVTDLGLQDSVIFTGFRKDVNNILAALDVSVQASLSENLGGTIESLLMECPTVATRSGGMVDSVHDGVTGILVKPLDADDLASGIAQLLRDRAWARSLGQAGRKLMLEEFTLNQTVIRLDALYDNLLSIHKPEKSYRRWMGRFRSIVAMPIFFYFGIRLVWDSSYYPIWVRRRSSVMSAVRTFSISSLRPDRLVLGFYRLIRTLVYQVVLRSYGFIRFLLQGTIILERWDKFFGYIRGQRQYGVLRSFKPDHLAYNTALMSYGLIRSLLKGTTILKRWDRFYAYIRGHRSQ